ncbi:hypothetical protein BAE44_0023618 [Dichanthelium oligosanthes]|uniref:PORR domain-containing protein n=1 Tax=Dichanthelium oligosanthes TaxID=888268 RepID=A0A1E5UR80_9POAL|nr:hypothetical protein BAE44_0023618 [Dichanthelium oligosanthes]
MANLIAEEDAVIRENEADTVQRLKKLLMLSTNETLNMHALWLVRRELGLPDDYRDDKLAVAKIEDWTKKEYTEKWLAESETKYAFPINFPTGFKIEKGFREKIKNWQRLPYIKPYEKNDLHPIHNVERLEKRIIGILHELLSLTVEKMIPLETVALQTSFCYGSKLAGTSSKVPRNFLHLNQRKRTDSHSVGELQ